MNNTHLIIADLFNNLSWPIPDNYVKLYKCQQRYIGDTIDDEYMLNCIFANFHSKLNNLLEILNYCVNGTKHFCAFESRDLIKIINDIIALNNDLKNTEYSFVINKSYIEIINKVVPFLRNTLGSKIPDDFKVVPIIKYDKIFKLETHISVTLNDKLDAIIKLISNENYSFYDSSIETNLATLNLVIEHILKTSNKGSYKQFDSEKLFHNFITDEDVKNFRNLTQCFRHATEDMLVKRRNLSDRDKIFLLNYGITICNELSKWYIDIKKHE